MTDGWHGSRYELRTPVGLVLAPTSEAPGLAVTDLLAHDAFAYRALGGSAGRVYLGLREADRTAAELVEFTGLSKATIYRALARLKDEELAVSSGGRWSAIEPLEGKLRSIASNHGTDGLTARRAEKHERERQANVGYWLTWIFGRDARKREWQILPGAWARNRKSGAFRYVYDFDADTLMTRGHARRRRAWPRGPRH